MNLHAGYSQDGTHWQIRDRPIEWIYTEFELAQFEHRYDPRVVWLEDRYYVTWCNGYHGPTIGIAVTALAFARMDEVLDFVKTNSEL